MTRHIDRIPGERFAGGVPSAFAVYRPGNVFGMPAGDDVAVMVTSVMLGIGFYSGALHEQDLDVFRSLEEKETYLTDVQHRMSAIVKEANGLQLNDDQKAEFAALEAAETMIQTRIDEQKYLLERIAGFDGASETVDGDDDAQTATSSFRRPGMASSTARRPESRRVPANVFDLGAYRRNTLSETDYARAMQDGAKLAVEQTDFYSAHLKSDDIRADVLELFGKIEDPEALARHILRTGSPAYAQAFAGFVSGRTLGPQEAQALELGSDPAGGFAVPVQLDPTLIATSDGAINSLRRIARTERITGKEWQGVTSTGITVRRGLEKTPAIVGDPTLAQPKLGTVKVDAFVPFTIELGLAWGSILSAMAPLLQDAKDEEEADSFVNGDGIDEAPFGLLGTMPDASRLSVGDFGSEDLYRLDGTDANHLAARWRARASFLGSKGIYNETRQFGDDTDGANLWARLADGTPARLLDYPTYEQSTMPSTSDDGNDILVLGDFNQFLIVDRIGMTIEVIQHLTQQATAGVGYGVPVGMRGLYAHWHNNAKILVPNAFRVLHVGAVGSGS